MWYRDLAVEKVNEKNHNGNEHENEQVTHSHTNTQLGKTTTGAFQYNKHCMAGLPRLVLFTWYQFLCGAEVYYWDNTYDIMHSSSPLHI